EVLGYCDPSKALSELSRTMMPGATLICDFRNSRGFRHLFTPAYGRAADIVVDDYNSAPERTWIYDPAYVEQLLTSFGFHLREQIGIHTWSAAIRRLGGSAKLAITVQRVLDRISLSTSHADLTTIVAERHAGER